MICFYHSADLDGHCSGALVKFANPECELYGINYGDPFPWDRVAEEDVVMVDFSLQPFDKMVLLNDLCPRLIWIDHHKSAIDEYDEAREEEAFEIDGVRTVGLAGCELTWQYFLPSTKMPTFVYLLGRYDVWDHLDPRTLPFQYGMRRVKDTLPQNQEFWASLLDVEKVNRIIEDGSIILEYQKSENEKYAEACAFETEVDGLRCIAINKMLTNSQLFDSVWNPDKYDAMLTFGYRPGGFWTVSLYTDKPGVDVSRVAKARGGGGHQGAAGFQCGDLFFLR